MTWPSTLPTILPLLILTPSKTSAREHWAFASHYESIK